MDGLYTIRKAVIEMKNLILRDRARIMHGSAVNRIRGLGPASSQERSDSKLIGHDERTLTSNIAVPTPIHSKASVILHSLEMTRHLWTFPKEGQHNFDERF